MMRVQRARKPSEANANYTELFFFDAHYGFAKLYCQQIRYGGRVAVPRVVGSICPSQDEECRNKSSMRANDQTNEQAQYVNKQTRIRERDRLTDRQTNRQTGFDML